jgi:tetratricopeptide (TPR) repeat protein
MADDVYAFLKKRLPKELNNRGVFFVGAGISAPSGLPTFQVISEKIIATISQGEVARDDAKFLAMALRPEVIYQIGIDELGTDTLLSMEVLEGGDPNPYHFLLAEALKRGCYIFTTNIDNLIEKACVKIGLSLGRDFYICDGQSDDEDFKKYVALIASGETLKPCIFKLHGSITFDNPQQKYDSIQFALRQVGKGLFESRRRVLEYFYHNFDFWVLGYSCRDDFSVFPALTASKSTKSSYWCEYDRGPLKVSFLGNDRLKWELEQEENKPLDQERDLGLLNINHFLTNRGRSYKIKGDLGKLLEARLCADLGITYDIPAHLVPLEMSSLDTWAKHVPMWKRHLYISRLFEEGIRWDKAIEFCQKAARVPLAEQLTVQQRQADLYYKEATPEASEKAIQFYQQRVEALSAGSTRANLKTNIANVLRRRGVGWLDQAHEKATEALKEFESSLLEPEREKSLEYANCLNIYGLSLYSQRKYDEAKTYFQRSIHIKEPLGDVNGIGESENAYSLVFTQEGQRFVKAGQKDEAIQKFIQAIEYAKTAVEARRKIGNRRGYAQNCRNLAWPNSELMKISESQEKIQEYFLKARDGYIAGLSTWLHITPPPPTEVVTFTNILVALYIDFCRKTSDRDEQKKWALVGLNVYNRFITEPKLKDQARLDVRAPTAKQNLNNVQELLLTLGLPEEAKKAEEMIIQFGFTV